MTARGHGEGLKVARLLMVLSSVSPLFILWAIRGTTIIPDAHFLTFCALMVLVPNAFLWLRLATAKKNHEARELVVGVAEDHREHLLVYLRARACDEVNFWQPSARRLAEFLEPGVPFLFKLHAPDNFIVGGGFFVRFSALPARVAWDAFGEKNGVTDYAALRKRIEQYRGATRGDPEIGCNVLNGPFFFDERDWIPVPESWARNIVRGRTFDTEDADGVRLWNAVHERLRTAPGVASGAEETPRFGAEYLTQARLGQGAFRVLVTEAYERRCAITGERGPACEHVADRLGQFRFLGNPGQCLAQPLAQRFEQWTGT